MDDPAIPAGADSDLSQAFRTLVIRSPPSNPSSSGNAALDVGVSTFDWATVAPLRTSGSTRPTSDLRPHPRSVDWHGRIPPASKLFARLYDRMLIRTPTGAGRAGLSIQGSNRWTELLFTLQQLSMDDQLPCLNGRACDACSAVIARAEMGTCGMDVEDRSEDECVYSYTTYSLFHNALDVLHDVAQADEDRELGGIVADLTAREAAGLPQHCHPHKSKRDNDDGSEMMLD